jgi:hypothetical protein
MSAANALQGAIVARLSGSDALMGALGKGGIHDRLVEAETYPTLRIVAIESRDWSTDSEPGEVHRLVIEARSGEGGNRVVQALCATVRALLHDQALVPAGHRLVNLRHEATRTGRDAAARGHVATMTFRAVTEPL